MPKRDDLRHILIIGSGPIVIGQAGEFDYSGTQAVKTLKEEGYRVSLVNSNPATIMTDPDLADATYMVPLTVEKVSEVLERERPDAILPTMGGQTALNLAVALARRITDEEYEKGLGILFSEGLLEGYVQEFEEEETDAVSTPESEESQCQREMTFAIS